MLSVSRSMLVVVLKRCVTDTRNRHRVELLQKFGEVGDRPCEPVDAM
jgi:hypothetical protein